MAYRPKYKASDGTLKDLPIDAETVNGKTPLFSTGIKVSAGSNINSVGTPSVSYSNGTFTFNYMKGSKGDKGDKGDTGLQDVELIKVLDNSSVDISEGNALLIVPVYDNSTITIKGTMKNGSVVSKTTTLSASVGMRICTWAVYLGGSQLFVANSGTDISKVTFSCGSTRFYIYELIWR